ncbi:MAG: TolC family outer membrane protein [Alphaproteobacteria bacterium]
MISASSRTARPFLAPLSLALAAGLAVAAPQSGRAQSLDEALISAYLNNPEIEAQRAALRATDEFVPQALSGWRPTLQITSSADISDIKSAAGKGRVDTTSNALSIDQNIYEGGATVANTRRAERLVRVERARLATVEQDVLLRAATAYTGLLTDLAVLELAVQNENRLRRQLRAARDRFEVGEVTRTDVAQAEARVAGAISERVRASGAIEASRAAFRNVVNLEPESLIPPAPLKNLPASETEAHQLAESLNPNILAAQFNLAAAREDVGVAESALYPRLSVNGELNYTDEPSLSVPWQRVASIGATLAVPLYQGGGEYAQVRQSKQTVQQRQADLDAVYRAVREEVTSAWQALVTARSSIESITEQVRAAEIALDGSRQEALVGQRTTLDVLDQENDLFQAEVDLVSAQRDEIVASYRLKAAVGALRPDGINLPVEPYDVEANYKNVRSRWFGLGNDLSDEHQE